MLAPPEDDVYRATRAFLLGVLPSGTDVILAQVNRVPEPQNPNFVVMTPLRRERIETNTDTYADCYFQGQIDGEVLTVQNVSYGSIAVGNTIFGVGIVDGTTVVRAQNNGTWLLSNTQTVATEGMAAGTQVLLAPTRVVLQLDVYGPASGDNTQIITTLFRDDYGTAFFLNFNAAITPLYMTDPRQVPFIDDQVQYENRWMIEAYIQVNESVTVPFQFADQLTPTLYPVDVVYPA